MPNCIVCSVNVSISVYKPVYISAFSVDTVYDCTSATSVFILIRDIVPDAQRQF